jgi:hypothetical protein
MFDDLPDFGFPIEDGSGPVQGVVGARGLVLLDGEGNRRAILSAETGRAALSFIRPDGTPVLQITTGEGAGDGDGWLIFYDAAGKPSAAVLHQLGKLALHARAGVVTSERAAGQRGGRLYRTDAGPGGPAAAIAPPQRADPPGRQSPAQALPHHGRGRPGAAEGYDRLQAERPEWFAAATEGQS